MIVNVRQSSFGGMVFTVRRRVCNMGCNQQSLMKFVPSIGVNVRELVLLPEINVFNGFGLDSM